MNRILIERIYSTVQYSACAKTDPVSSFVMATMPVGSESMRQFINSGQEAQQAHELVS